MGQQANITLWIIAVRHRIREEPAGPRRDYLAEMLVELYRRLPEKG